MMWPLALLREATASARSQIVVSVLTIAMIAGMCVAALLTTGRTVAAEHAVLAQVDAAGTRSITVRADADAGIITGLLDQIAAITQVDAVAGFGPITDARNAHVPAGPPVALRQGYGTIGADAPLFAGLPDTALASKVGAAVLGLADGTGGVVTTAGHQLTVNGELAVPDHLAFLEPLVVVPSSSPDQLAGEIADDPLTLIVILTDAPHHVAPVATTIQGLLDGVDRTMITMETSEQLADIRAAIGGELGTHGRATVLAILAISGVLVAVNLLALVTMRRKDFGRRRALGATQMLIIGLLVTQVGILAIIGTVLGITAGLAALSATGNPLPDPAFSAAVTVAAILTAVIAALPPAVIASRRDPLHELRVP